MTTTINLTSGDDTYASAAGDYAIYGMGGNDTITTGAGNNSVYTGDGNQAITTGAGTSTVVTGNGNSAITTGAGEVHITVGNGNNTIVTGAGNATVTTGNGNESITAGAGNDVIETGIGNSIVLADAGDDVLVFHVAGNQATTTSFAGGAGVDTLRLVLTHAEWTSDAVQADITAYRAFQAAHTAAGGEADAAGFKFNTFGLTATAIEKLEVLVDGVLIDPNHPVFDVANDIIATTEKTWSVPVDVLANDSAPATIQNLSYTDPAHGSLQFTPDYAGTASAPSARFVYMPTAGFYDYLAAGETATDSFTYTVTDATGTAKTATVAVIVTGTNDAPVITSQPQTGAVLAGTDPSAPGITAVGQITYRDVDLSDGHTLNIDAGPAHGVASVDSSGAWSYTLSNDSAVNALPVGQHLTDSFSVSIDDLQGGKVSQLVTIDITRVNHAPLANPDTDASILAGGPATDHVVLDVLANDTDTDPGDQAGLQVVSASSAHGATVGISGVPGAGITYSAGHAFDYLAAGATVLDTVSYTIRDEHGAVSNTATASVLVTGVNAAPVVTAANLVGAVTDQVVPAGDLSSSGTITFADVNLADTHTLGAVTPAADVIGTLTATLDSDTDHATGAGGRLTWTYNVANAAIDFLAFGQSKVETFTFDLLDGHGGSVTNTVNVTLTGTNQAPVITNPVSALAGSVTEDTVLMATGQLTASDADAGATQTWRVLGAAVGSYGAMAVNATTGIWTYAFDDANHQSLAADERHTETFTVRVTDDQGATADQQVSVVVNGTNDAPSAAVFDNGWSATTGTVTKLLMVPAGSMLNDTGAIHFDDVDVTDTHTLGPVISQVGNLGHLTASLDTDTADGTGGVVTWSYSVANAALADLLDGQTKVETFTFNVSDGHGGSMTNTITQTIVGATEIPVLTDQLYEAINPAWNSLMNDYGVWITSDGGSANQDNLLHSVVRQFETSGSDADYMFTFSADNIGSVFVDGVAIPDLQNIEIRAMPSAVVHLAAGLHTLIFDVQNAGGPAGFSLEIDDAAGQQIWNTRSHLEPEVLLGNNYSDRLAEITEPIVDTDVPPAVPPEDLPPMSTQLYEASNPGWNSLMNDYGVWITSDGGSANQDNLLHSVVRQFDTSGSAADFTFTFAADNIGSVFVDGVAIPDLQNIEIRAMPSAVVHLAAGTHTLIFDVQNAGGVAGFSLEVDDAAGQQIWTTHSHLESQVLVGVDMDQLAAHGQG